MAKRSPLAAARGALLLDGPAHGCYGCRYFPAPPTREVLGHRSSPWTFRVVLDDSFLRRSMALRMRTSPRTQLEPGG